MSAGRTINWGRRAVATVVSTALVMVVGSSAAAVPEDAPPTITGTTIDPSGLPAVGGLITITAEVVDDVGVARVDATLYSPDGASGSVNLLASGPMTFRGTFLVPPNVSDSSVNWNIEISALDSNGADAMAFTGGVEVAGQPQFDEPPDVWDPTVTPPSLATAGGTVVIGVSAWDLRGITDGSATVTGPDHAASYVELQPVSADRFEGVFTAPANTGPAAVQYGVTVAVHDDIGQESTVDAGTFAVAGRPAAASGTLTVSPSARVFGPVGAGRSATRTVVVRNTGAPGSAPVEATAAVIGRSFAVAGDGSFTLAPGESSTMRISYSPTRPGLDLARLVIRREDGRQSPLGAVLIGLATRRP